MSHLETPHFPRGFVLSERFTIQPPPAFVPGPILDNLYIHPWTHVASAGDAEQFVIIIGHAVSVIQDHLADPAQFLLARLAEGEAVFLRELDHFSGRHAIIFGRVGNIKIVNDAIGMRTVFYAATGGVVASHAILVEQALGGEITRRELPFRYGYPGNRTPFSRTRILTPNTYYWVTANIVQRFWPITRPAPVTVDEAAEVLLEASVRALRDISAQRAVKVTLTAGLDSRTILAIALHAGVPFETYTYGTGEATRIDREIGAVLAEYAQVPHTIVGQAVHPDDLMTNLHASHYSMHHSGWVGALRKYFQDVDTLAVLGNSLEIGRSNYAPIRRKGVAAPGTAETMVALHQRKLGPAVAKRVDDFGPERFKDVSRAAFQAFIDETGYDIVSGMLDPFDQFYWEHRMSTWQGVAMGERDFYALPFIPFNARWVFETLLGVEFEHRRTDAAVYRMIELVDPGLLNIPINPKHWPQKNTRKAA